MPTAVEVDPETPAPAVPFRLLALVPSLLGLPLRLRAVWLLDEMSLLAELLMVALDRIHPAGGVVERREGDALCDAEVPCITQPVTVTVLALAVAEVRVPDVLRREVSPCCPLLLEGAVCADATASDNTAAAHVLPTIHLCIYPLPRRCGAMRGDAAMWTPD